LQNALVTSTAVHVPLCNLSSKKPTVGVEVISMSRAESTVLNAKPVTSRTSGPGGALRRRAAGMRASCRAFLAAASSCQVAVGATVGMTSLIEEVVRK